MADLEEYESWHEDLMAWECYQDELERIKGGDYGDDDKLEIESETDFFEENEPH